MIDNIEVFEKMIAFAKKHKVTAVIIVGTGTILATVLLNNAINSKPKEVFPYMPRVVVEESVKEEPKAQEYNPLHMTTYVEVALNQIIRLEPRSDAKYVTRIDGIKDAELLYIDGDYALISYETKEGTIHLGYIDASSISHRDRVGLIYQANKLNMYGEITTDRCRLQNDTSNNNADHNILTRGTKGEYVKIIGEYKEGKDTWYLVTYRNYIGYMKPENLRVMTEEGFYNTVNTNYVEIVGTRVRFRSSPKLDKDNIILEFNKGTKLPVVSRDGDWYQVYYNGTYGYVSTRSDCTKELYEQYVPPGLSSIHLERESNGIIL